MRRAVHNGTGGATAPVHNVQDLSMVISRLVARRAAVLRLVPVLGVIVGTLWTAAAFAQTPAANPASPSRPAAPQSAPSQPAVSQPASPAAPSAAAPTTATPAATTP